VGDIIHWVLALLLTTLSFLGYKLRKHISNAIVRRSAAVRASLEWYNKLAPLQTPPCPVLEYAKVASYGWLGDFALLKISRHDILTKPWTVPANRDISRKHFKVLRAQEEMYRLNIEVRQLQAWIDEEEDHIRHCAEEKDEVDPHLSAELCLRYAEQSRINGVHRACLQSIYCLQGYSGIIPSASEEMTSANSDLEGHMPFAADDDQLNDEAARQTTLTAS
jgi:hypothetical protein